MLLFQWDETKAAINKNKHGVEFLDAMYVFEDPYALLEMDRIVEGEMRWQAIGMAGGMTVLLIAHTFQEAGGDDIVRIISARRANRTERRRYEQNRYQNPD